MFEPLNYSYRKLAVTSLLVLTGLLWASPRGQAQG